MSVINTNYYTVRESIEKGFVTFSSRHLKRLINDQLQDENNSKVIYQTINGIKTIIIHKTVLDVLQRRRKPKKKCVKSDVYKHTYLTEVTIGFKNPFNKNILTEIIKNYPSNKEYNFVIEGIGNKRHVHMMVQDNTATALNKIEHLLDKHKIGLEETNLLVRSVNNTKQYNGYKMKYDEVETNYNDEDHQELEIIDTGKSYFSPFGRNDYKANVFRYKCNNCRNVLMY